MQSNSWACIWRKSIMKICMYTPMFIAALFTIPRHGSNLNVHQEVNKEDTAHIYNGILFSLKVEYMALSPLASSTELTSIMNLGI